MDSCYPEPPINPNPVKWRYPQPSYVFSNPEARWWSLNPPPDSFFRANPEAIWSSPYAPAVVGYVPAAYVRWTEGTGLHELRDNSSPGAAKADEDTGARTVYVDDDTGARTAYVFDDRGALGIYEYKKNGTLRGYFNLGVNWENFSDSEILKKLPRDGGSNEPSCDGKNPTDTLSDKIVADGCGGLNGERTTVESMGTVASAHKCDCEERSSESQAAWKPSVEEETGGWDSCGNACYACAGADHFSRTCSLGADCEWSAHGSGGNTTTSYIV